ncbi:MAG: hypothetical protein H7Y18_05730, partial [Clostridiaceae bacterium]|nr:hypothetical protein [Clostridiaceae bacterium]
MFQEQKYYSTREHLEKLYCEKTRKLGFKAENLVEYDLWKTELRIKLKEILGLNSMSSCVLTPEVV